MNLKEKRQREQDEMKLRRMEHVLDCAFELFCEHGIDSVSMNEIALKAEIGVASLYRYFVTKESLAIQCAKQAWDIVADEFAVLFEDPEYKEKNGFGQIIVIFSIFCELYRSKEEFFRFICYFDSYIHRNNVSIEALDSYEAGIQGTKEIVMSALQKGFEDGSIRKELRQNDNGETLYYTLMHSLFALAQKLSVSGTMLAMNKKVSGSAQMKTLSQLLIAALQ